VWGRTRGFPEALLAMVFVASCPLLVYYGTGFHPDPAAFDLLILGLSLVLGWGDPPEPSERTVITGVGLMTLAGLVKMSMAPYLLVPVAVLMSRSVQRSEPVDGAINALRRLPRGPALALIAGFLLLVIQFMALQILAWGYAPTFFTASPHPFRSPEHFVTVIQQALKAWMVYLFTEPQLLVLALALGHSITRCFRKHDTDDLSVATAVTALVMVGLFVLFGQQYAWHDYYAIATFYPMAALVTVRLALAFHWRPTSLASWTARVVVVLAMLGLVYSMGQAVRPLLERRTARWWRLQVAWLDHGRELLETCGEACAGPVAVLGSEPPNLALTHLDRQGYVLGVDLREGLGVPYFGCLERLVQYLDARGVRVLVVRKSALDRLPWDQVATYFEIALEKDDVVVLIRRGRAEAGEQGNGSAVGQETSARGFMVPSSGDQRMVLV